MKLVLVDAYDSFTYNLAQAFSVLGARVEVVLCDRIDAAGLRALRPDRVVLGPGPGRPEQAGIVGLVRALGPEVPVLGVCLGHQALALAFGGRVVRHVPVHGHATPIHHDGTGLFRGLQPAVPMTRYHSLVVDRATLPACLHITAVATDGAIMGLRHRSRDLAGIQFHPESVLSGSQGLHLLANYLDSGADGIAASGTSVLARATSRHAR